MAGSSVCFLLFCCLQSPDMMMAPWTSEGDRGVLHSERAGATSAWLASLPGAFEYSPWGEQGDADGADYDSSDKESVATEPFYPPGSEQWGYAAVDFYTSGVGETALA